MGPRKECVGIARAKKRKKLGITRKEEDRMRHGSVDHSLDLEFKSAKTPPIKWSAWR